MKPIEKIKCEACDASLTYQTGSENLVCPYCGHAQAVKLEGDAEDFQIQEFDIDDYVKEVFSKEQEETVNEINCHGCSAKLAIKSTTEATLCPFCSTSLIMDSAKINRIHRPHYILPFAIKDKDAQKAFQRWLKKRWFAPNALKKMAIKNDKLQGVYLPFWTFDCTTTTRYRGQRGETYTETRSNNQRVTKVRWYSVSGEVTDAFDDILIPATESLPLYELEALEPWDLEALKPYDQRYLAGFSCETYRLTLRQGFFRAREKMEKVIRRHIKRAIGGDRQRISQMATEYHRPTFKHILLPCWISAYRFKGKTYRFFINARTAEVQGERPYSWIKIGLFVLLIAALVVTGFTVNWPELHQKILLWWQGEPF